MRESLRGRIGRYLERLPVLGRLVLQYDGPAPTGRRYVNRVNGYTVVR